MAGTIAITNTKVWSVNSSAYHWVLDYLIEHITDPDIKRQLQEIDENNLGWLDLGDFAEPHRSEILLMLTDQIVPDAERRIFPGKPDREKSIDVFRELQALARQHVQKSSRVP